MPAFTTGLFGLLGGMLIGALVQRSRLCTFGAIEDALAGHDWRRMKVFGLALGLALLVTQALILGGALDPDRISYLPERLPIVGLVVGGLMFGVGMALVGTCGFGSLIRLGTGDLRSLVVILIFGVAAYASLRGVLSGFRIGVIEQWSILMPGPSRSDIPTQMERVIGIDARALLTGLVAAFLVTIAIRDARLKRSPRLLAAAVALGLVTGFAWAVTGWFSDPFDLHARPQSLTFVAPIARALFGVLAGQDSIYDFGVASVIGGITGSFLASFRARECRWEAFDDQREMRRHITGGALMGVGGVLAGGCTIGQGLAAGSAFALSMPIALVAMMAGARLGIAILVGEMHDILARFRR